MKEYIFNKPPFVPPHQFTSPAPAGSYEGGMKGYHYCICMIDLESSNSDNPDGGLAL